MAKDDTRSAAKLRRSANAERLCIREEWSALKEIERNTLNESQENTSMKQKPIKNFVIRYPIKACKGNNVFKNPTPKRKRHLSTSEALRGLVVYVDVGSASKALALRAALSALGATVSPVWSKLVTHLVWSEGGCRQVRSTARALACKLVSPLWVEACAAAAGRLPEGSFPAASRPSDLPSPKTLKQMLKTVEQENGPPSLPGRSRGSERSETPRPRLPRDADENTGPDASATGPESMLKNINEHGTRARIGAPARRAPPRPTSAARPSRSKRRLFTQRELDAQTHAGVEADEDGAPAGPETRRGGEPAQRKRRNPTSRLVRRLVGTKLTGNRRGAAPQRSDGPPAIVLTGMSRRERRDVSEAVRHLHGRIQNTVNKRTTHVLLGGCRPSGASTIYNCDKCGSADDALRQKTEAVLAARETGGAENTTCKCLSTNSNRGDDGRGDPDTSPLDRQKESRRAAAGRPRTLSALLGAVRGCRVLHSKWALDSREVNRWVHHFGYEVKHLKKVAEKARFERSALQKMHSEYAYDIFDGATVHISRGASRRAALARLLALCGAAVRDGRRADVTLGRGGGQTRSEWVFDSVAAGRARAVGRYVNPTGVDDL